MKRGRSGERRKILFVCSGNTDRSPTAEEMLRGKPGYEVKSAGTLRSAPTLLSKSLVQWADTIFVMEEKHKEAVLAFNAEVSEKIIVLNIRDVYVKNDPYLKRILSKKLERLLS